MKRAIKPDLSMKGRPFWREIHATLGIVLAAGAVFFVMSGLPWTSTWGAQFKQLVAQVNLGYPPDPPGAVSARHEGHEGHEGAQASATRVQDLPLEHTAWGAGLLSVPNSTLPAEGHQGQPDHSHGAHAGQGAQSTDAHAMHAGHVMPAATSEMAEPITLDQVMTLAHANHIPDEYSIALPAGKTGVYSVSYYPGDPTGEKVINVDQYDGSIINGVAYDQYGLIAKVISFAVSLHMGTYFGWVNQLLCAIIALGLVAMAVTGFAMWWKRRPAGSLGAPRIPAILPSMRGWVAGLIVFGLVFPVTGVSMLVVWALDRLYLARYRRRLDLGTNTV